MEGKRKSKDGGGADSSLVDPLPDWVRNFMRRHHGCDPQFALEKTITATDLNKEQNRLLIPSHFVESHILPMMDEHEKRVANLQSDIVPLKKRKIATEENAKEAEDRSASEKKKEGIDHGGLPVSIYDQAGWRFSSVLVRRDTNSTVLRGGEWLQFAEWSGFRVNDKIEMWGFRRGDGRLCFVLRKK